MSAGMSEVVTQGIRVRVQVRYLEEHSQPGRFVFAYTVSISNEADTPAQLVSRHWIITDADGQEEHVRGAGVVGRQPLIEPGETHEYSSFCPLPTPFGAMRGTYRMVRPDGSEFDAVVAPFTLALPHTLN
jgi:ApaG protein